MKGPIFALFVIYITSVASVSDFVADYRYPYASGRIIQGVLNGTNLIRVYFEINKDNTEIDYYVMDNSQNCGPYKVQATGNSHLLKDIDVVPLTTKNLLVLPYQYGSGSGKNSPTKVELINFSTCEKVEVALPTELYDTERLYPAQFRVTSYDDSFDIYFVDSSICGQGVCKKSYDYQGNVISTENFLQKEDSIQEGAPLVKPIGGNSRSGDQVAIVHKKNEKLVYLVKNGDMKLLTKFDVETEYPNQNRDLTPLISTSHNVISIVYRQAWLSLVVVQFDFEGNLKFQTTIPYNFFIRTARILNSADDEVYVVASECERDHCNEHDNVYVVKKLDSKGNVVGSLNLTLPLPSVLVDLSFHEYDQAYCLTEANFGIGASLTDYFKKVDINTKCFTNEDF